MFSRVLVANRGEIAVRVIRALHELGIEAVAVYSTADSDALHVRLADQAVCIGPPAAADSYLRISNVIAAAETTGCEAVHPGYGFLVGERRVRARLRRERPRLHRAAGGRHRARWATRCRRRTRCARPACRSFPAPKGSRRSPRFASQRGELGFPVLLKATAGGGGKGMRVVDRSDGARGRIRRRERRGRGRVRRRVAVPREGARAGAPRRDPGAL